MKQIVHPEALTERPATVSDEAFTRLWEPRGYVEYNAEDHRPEGAAPLGAPVVSNADDPTAETTTTPAQPKGKRGTQSEG